MCQHVAVDNRLFDYCAVGNVAFQSGDPTLSMIGILPASDNFMIPDVTAGCQICDAKDADCCAVREIGFKG